MNNQLEIQNFKLEQKNKNLEKKLNRIYNSKLWKIFLIYKKFQIILSKKKQSTQKYDFIFKYKKGTLKENRVLGICYNNWVGVKSATLNQCSDVLIIKKIINKKNVLQIIKFIENNRFEKISINAILDGTDVLIKEIKKAFPKTKIYLIWHGSFTQQTIEDHIMRFNKLQPYFKHIHKFGFVKNDMDTIFKKMGYSAEFLPNRINNIVKKNKLITKDQKIKVGILSVFSWHKNNINQILGGCMSPIISEVHVLNIPNIFYLKKILQNKIKQHNFLIKKDYLKLLQDMDINLYVSITECYPMTFLESLSFGVPCIIGNTSKFIIQKNKFLLHSLVVNNPEDIYEIRDKINNIVKNYEEVSNSCIQFIKKINQTNTKKIINFFKN